MGNSPSRKKGSTSSMDTPSKLPVVSDEELAEVADATKSSMEKPGGRSMEIVLSPATKKPIKRLYSANSSISDLTQEAIDEKLKGADDRRREHEAERLKNISAQLARVPVVQHEKEVREKVKMEAIQGNIESELCTAGQNMDKVSMFLMQIENAQKNLESSLEAARLAAENNLGCDNQQMEEMLNKIKEHEEKVRIVRASQEKMKPFVEELQLNIQSMEKQGRELREKQNEQKRREEKICRKQKLEQTP